MSFISIFKKKLFFLVVFFIFFSKLYSSERDFKNSYQISSYKKPSSNWILSLDLLAWYASQEVSSIYADIVTLSLTKRDWQALGFEFNLDFGFRLSAGYKIKNYDWESKLSWTWFKTDNINSISKVTDPSSISPEFFAAFLSSDSFQSMRVKWRILYNSLDWELGKNFFFSKTLFFQPFLGIKAGWINQDIAARYFNLKISDVPTNNSGAEKLKNNFWGIGPQIGLYSKWKFLNFQKSFLNFSSDFSMATMWGMWHCSDIYKNSISKISSVNTENSALAELMVKGFFGFEYNIQSNPNNSFMAKLGYEMQLWLNQLRIATFQLQRLRGDLSLQGITFNCRLDF